MATERMPQPDKQVPYPYELDPELLPAEPAPITQEDLIRLAERLEAGHADDSYRLGRRDLEVLGQLTSEQWRQMRENPAAFAHDFASDSHA